MQVVATIAGHVVRDALRSRVLHAAVLVALGVAVTAPIAGRLTAGQDLKVVKDLCLAAMNLAGLFVAVFMGTRMLAREIERRTADLVLSKPIRRREFILGQYFGLLATLTLSLSVMAVAMYVVLVAMTWSGGGTGSAVAPPGAAADPFLLKAVFLIFVQLSVVAAAALSFSTFSSPALAVVSTCALYAAGHFAVELRNIEDVVDSGFTASLLGWLSYVLPDLASFDVKSAVVHGQSVTAGYIALTSASGAAYILALLVLALAVFARRDLA